MAETKEVTDQELAKGLIGKRIILGPQQALFFEDNEQYVLTAYPDIEREDKEGRKVAASEFDKTEVTIQEGWKLESTLRNVRKGVLRVLDKDGKDITREFGGPEKPLNRKSTPLVTVPKVANPLDQRDQKLLRILDDINPIDIIKNLTAIRPSYDVLERVLQLELAGENPAYRSRQAVVEGIKEIMKNTTGIGAPGKLQDEENLSASKK